MDELIAKGLRFALQIRQHPITIFLFIRLLSRINVRCPIPQHAIDQPGQLMRGRRNRFGCPEPGPYPTVIAPKALWLLATPWAASRKAVAARLADGLLRIR